MKQDFHETMLMFSLNSASYPCLFIHSAKCCMFGNVYKTTSSSLYFIPTAVNEVSGSFCIRIDEHTNVRTLVQIIKGNAV